MQGIYNTDNVINYIPFNDSRIIQIDFVNAALWLVTRECIKHVGLFDPIFPHYGEDNNFAQRAIHKGLKLVYMKKFDVPMIASKMYQRAYHLKG